MGKGTIKTKAMTMAVAMSMVAGLCPSTVFAASGSEVAADGTYTKTAHVTRIESEDSDDEWNEYDVEVSLTVKDGKFEDITVTPGEGYDSGNSKLTLIKLMINKKESRHYLKDKLQQKM